MPYIDKNKHREYQRKWYNDRRRKWVEENGPCRKCSSESMLEVDHIDPRTKVSSNIWSWSKSRREIELAKCQVLCRPCHEDKCRIDGSWSKRQDY